MKIIGKKAVSFLLALIICVSLLPLSVFAENLTTLAFEVETVSAVTGSSAKVKINIKHNPGISSVKLLVEYDESLTLASVEYNNEMGGQFMQPSNMSSPATLVWLNPFGEFKGDATFATLTFTTPANMSDSYEAPIILNYNEDDIYNFNEDNVSCRVISGGVRIFAGVPGDINGDGVLNNKDLTRLFQYMANWDVEVNQAALDTNGDGSVNNKDLTRLFQYLADWDVELFYGSTIGHKHLSKFIEEKKATCVDAGNISYYYCEECSGFFTDAACKNEVSQIDVTIEPKGHTVVIDEAVSATTTSTGKTEGSHCSECTEVLVKQDDIPKLEPNQYPIKYELSNGDLYLASVDIENPNDNFYTSESGVDSLKEPKIAGYKFLGWFKDSVDDSRRVTSIPKGTTGEITLYPHWEKNVYNITYDSDGVPLNSAAQKTYTVDEGAVLIPPEEWDGYYFISWQDDEGNTIDRIPIGHTGNITLHAYWLSARNRVWSKKQLDDPIIIEDDDSNTILFTYEIGQVENVPMYVVHDFGRINNSGVPIKEKYEYTATASETLMEQYSRTIADSTTNSSQWSLSSGWSDSVTVNEQWLKENNMTLEEAKEKCTNDENNWLVSNGSSGSTSTTVYASSQDYDLLTTNNSTKTIDEREKGTHVEIGTEAEVTTFLGGGKITASGGGKEDHKTGTEGEEGSENQTGSVKHTGSDASTSSSWNSANSYGGSQSLTESESIKNILSSKISEQYNIGKSYINTGSETNTQGYSSTSSNSNSYSSNVTYSTQVIESSTIEYDTVTTKTGYHRTVIAGTALVFAIVGYDIKNDSYFVSTFSVMDDNYYSFQDYSFDSPKYDDYQNSVIKFEIPYEVEEYVLSRVGETKGLIVDDFGYVKNYSGNEKTVFIPEYHVTSNRDGTKKVVKVIGIDENAFKNNRDITGVELSEFITEIPACSFSGCSSLSCVNMTGVISIGEKAFENCCQVKKVFISDTVNEIGKGAFANVEALILNASNPNVIDQITRTKAKNITVNITESFKNLDEDVIKIYEIFVPDDTDTFTINGNGLTLKNIAITSNSNKLILNNVSLYTNNITPLIINSNYVELGRVKINSTGLSIIINADNCEIGLYGTNSIASTSNKAILCKNLTLLMTEDSIENDVYSELDVNGNILTTGKVDGQSLLNHYGTIKTITESVFYKYINGITTVTFNTNGGSLSSTPYKDIEVGKPVGALPVPTRSDYIFNGWYTAVEGGEIVDENTIFTDYSDVVLYAHWSTNSYIVSWSAGTGTTITVNRTSSPNPDATIGTLSSGDKVYYGDVLSVSYKAKTGYTLSTNGKTSITVNGNITSSDIFATAKLNSYTASWSAGTGTTITVNRTNSPYGGAATGSLSSGAKVYYGDVLSVTYSAKTGYTLATKGSASITVKGDITSSNIYATATAKSYTYNIVYKSSNGTDLGTSTVTKSYGTTNTISAPAKTGYTTPSSQTVKWDSTSAKTITFKYTPATVNKSQAITNKKWKNGVTYSFWFEYRNRTSTTIDVRVTYSATVDPGYTANYNLIGAVSTYYGTNNSKHIYCDYTMPTSQFNTASGVERSVGGSSAWTTISVSAKTNTLYFQTSCWTDPETVVQTDEATLKIPTY